MNALLPEHGESVEALEIDPTADHSLTGSHGARWVLLNWDVGSGARRILETTVDGVSTVGQAVGNSVGQRMAGVRPEEEIMSFFQAAREASRVEYARNALRNATVPLPALDLP